MSGVQITFTAEDRDLLASFQRQQAEILKQQRALLKMGDAAAKAGQAGKRGADDTTAAWLGTDRALRLTGAAIQALIQKTEEGLQKVHQLRLEAAQSSETFDDALRGFLIQQGPGGLTRDQAARRATQIADVAGVSQISALRIGRQALSTGFQNPLARGGAVESVISYLQSTGQNVDQADLEGIVSGAARQLQAGRQELTGANLTRLLVQTRGLYGSTPLESPDLVPFAQARGVATQVGISQPEFLAAAAITKGQLDAAQGATGLSNFITRLAGGDPTARRTLQGIGVAPETVDLSGEGEGLQQASRVIGQALQRLPEDQRVAALAGIVGREKTNLTAADALIQAAMNGQFQQYIGFTGDVAGYERGVNLARGGIGAARRRVEAQKVYAEDRATNAGALPETLLEDVVQAENRATHARLTQEGRSTALIGTVDYLNENFRLPGQYTADEQRAAQSFMQGGSYQLPAEIKQSLDQNTRATERNTRASERPPAAGLSRTN